MTFSPRRPEKMVDTVLFQLLLTSLLVISCTSLGYPGNCPCPAVYDPVCGFDGRTYSNSCAAQCVFMPVRCEGECPCSNCPCPRIYDPVCGIDGRTYSNACLARCNGVYLFTPGECSGSKRY